MCDCQDIYFLCMFTFNNAKVELCEQHSQLHSPCVVCQCYVTNFWLWVMGPFTVFILLGARHPSRNMMKQSAFLWLLRAIVVTTNILLLTLLWESHGLQISSPAAQCLICLGLADSSDVGVSFVCYFLQSHLFSGTATACFRVWEMSHNYQQRRSKKPDGKSGFPSHKIFDVNWFHSLVVAKQVSMMMLGWTWHWQSLLCGMAPHVPTTPKCSVCWKQRTTMEGSAWLELTSETGLQAKNGTSRQSVWSMPQVPTRIGSDVWATRTPRRFASPALESMLCCQTTTGEDENILSAVKHRQLVCDWPFQPCWLCILISHFYIMLFSESKLTHCPPVTCSLEYPSSLPKHKLI